MIPIIAKSTVIKVIERAHESYFCDKTIFFYYVRNTSRVTCHADVKISIKLLNAIGSVRLVYNEL